MKRAEVWRDRSSSRSAWCVGLCNWRDRDRARPIHRRREYLCNLTTFPTHAEALAHALAETGLTEQEK